MCPKGPIGPIGPDTYHCSVTIEFTFKYMSEIFPTLFPLFLEYPDPYIMKVFTDEMLDLVGMSRDHMYIHFIEKYDGVLSLIPKEEHNLLICLMSINKDLTDYEYLSDEMRDQVADFIQNVNIERYIEPEDEDIIEHIYDVQSNIINIRKYTDLRSRLVRFYRKINFMDYYSFGPKNAKIYDDVSTNLTGGLSSYNCRSTRLIPTYQVQ